MFYPAGASSLTGRYGGGGERDRRASEQQQQQFFGQQQQQQQQQENNTPLSNLLGLPGMMEQGSANAVKTFQVL